MLVELTEDNIDGYVKVESCKIAQGTGTFFGKGVGGGKAGERRR